MTKVTSLLLAGDDRLVKGSGVGELSVFNN